MVVLHNVIHGGATMDIVQKLRAAATGKVVWSVEDDNGNSVISFDHDNAANPEQEAKAWLKRHEKKGFCRGMEGEYDVVKLIVHDSTDDLLIEAAAEIERLKALVYVE
jgi:hypothetical protein